MTLGGTREWRVTLALKWKHLDGCTVEEIRDRFEAEGYGRPSRRTVYDYLDEEETEAVLDQIRAKHAETRLQIADREEQAYRRARADERRAVRDEPVMGIVPKMEFHRDEAPIRVSDWEVVDPADERYPEWAHEWPADRVVAIAFTDETRWIDQGESYPVGAMQGKPVYRTVPIGYLPDQPDLQERRAARYEQTAHLENKGKALGVYTEHVELDVDEERSLDEEDKGELLAAIEQLRGGDGGDG